MKSSCGEFMGCWASYIAERQRDGAMVKIDPAIVVRAFIGMIVHHSLNNNLWDPKRRLLKISNEEAAKHFADILLNGISIRERTQAGQEPAKGFASRNIRQK